MKCSLDDVIRARHAVANIRPVPVIGVDSPRITGATARAAGDQQTPGRTPQLVGGEPIGEAANNVVALRPGAATAAGSLPIRPAGRPSLSTVAALDGANRLAAIKVTDSLGWSPGEALYAQCALGRVVVRAGKPSEPTHLPVKFDRRKHLCLPPTAVAGLGACPGAQLFATAGDDSLYLANAAVVAEHVTGVIPLLTNQLADPPATEPAPIPTRGTHVRPRWRAEAAAVPSL